MTLRLGPATTHTLDMPRLLLFLFCLGVVHAVERPPAPWISAKEALAANMPELDDRYAPIYHISPALCHGGW